MRLMIPRIFTNGTFDGFHKGHYDLLRIASELGDVYLGLNSDESIQRLKGPHRPFYPYAHRENDIIKTGFVKEIYKIEQESDIISRILETKASFLLKGSDTLTDLKYSQITGKSSVKAIIYIDVGDMSIHSSNLFQKEGEAIVKKNK